MPVPQDLLDKLTAAEDALDASRAAARAQQDAAAAVVVAMDVEAQAQAAALVAAQYANVLAQDFIAAAKTALNIIPTT